MDSIYERARKIIQNKRDILGYSYRMMSEKLQYKSKSTYYMIENGPTEITLKQFAKLIKILKITKKEVLSIFFNC